MKIKKIRFLILFCIFLFFIFALTLSPNIYAGIFDSSPEIVTKLNTALESIEAWLITLATPAAAVAVGVGVFMKKFSFGDEERIRVAKKLIRGSLFSYGFILAINLILAAIKSLVA